MHGRKRGTAGGGVAAGGDGEDDAVAAGGDGEEDAVAARGGALRGVAAAGLAGRVLTGARGMEAGLWLCVRSVRGQ